MSEHDNLQDADGENLNDTPQVNSKTEQPASSEETSTEEVPTEEAQTIAYQN